MDSKQRQQALSRGFSFWPHLTPMQQQQLLEQSRLIDYQKGESVYDGERECVGLLLVRQGTLRVYTLSEEGRQITLYRLGEGEVCVLSASCVLEAVTFPVHVEAEGPCRTLALSALAVERLIRDNVYVESYCYRLATGRFSQILWVMQQVVFHGFDRRLACYLLRMDRQNGGPIALTHEAMAADLGSAREVVSRMLHRFAGDGLVRLERGRVEVLDRERLQKIAMECPPEADTMATIQSV